MKRIKVKYIYCTDKKEGDIVTLYETAEEIKKYDPNSIINGRDFTCSQLEADDDVVGAIVQGGGWQFVDGDDRYEVIEDNYCEVIEVFSEPTLEVADIRNKLGSIVSLIDLVQMEDYSKNEYIVDEIKRSKEAVNYLAQREVF